jgi:hypothetical protein
VGVEWPASRTIPALVSHGQQSLPVGEWIADPHDPYLATLRLAPSGISQEADTVRGLLESGILRGVSIGFRPRNAKPNALGGRDMIAELLEASLVAIPANLDAQVLHAVKALLAARRDEDDDGVIEIVGPEDMIELPDGFDVGAAAQRAVTKALLAEGERLVKFWTPPGPDYERRDEATRNRLRARGVPVFPTWAAAQAAKAELDRPADPWPVSMPPDWRTRPGSDVLALIRQQLAGLVSMLALIDENDPTFGTRPSA